MADGDDRQARSRGPLYAVIAVVVGVAGAIIFGLSSGGGTSAGASASPQAIAVVSPAPSNAGSVLPGSSDAAATPDAGSAPPVASLDPSPTTAATPSPTPKPTARPTLQPTPRPSATPNTNPAFVTLTVPKTEDCTGGTAGTIHLSWSIRNATGVTLAIDGGGLYDTYPGTSNAVDVPFACSQQQLSHTYTFTTTGGTGPAARFKRTVTTAKAQIKTFRLGPAVCPAKSASAGVTVSITVQYEIVAATGITLDRDGTRQFALPGKTSSSGLKVTYNCTQNDQLFVLTTTGGYGSEAVRSINVVAQRP